MASKADGGFAWRVCVTCGTRCGSAGMEKARFCNKWTPKLPTTHNGLIRTMTSEELARWIWAVQTGIYHEDIGSSDEWLDWLQSPAEGGGGDG